MIRQRRFSYGVYIVIAFSILLSFFYESFQPRNIESVTIVSGLGLEKGEESDIKLTIQMIKPQKGETGTSTSSSMIISGEGNSVTEAVEAIILKTGSVLFWAHCSVILIDKGFAENEDIMPHLDMFFRSANFRNTASVIISDKPPGDVFGSSTIFEMVSAFGIQKLLDDQKSESNSVYMPLKKFVMNYYMKSNSVVVAGVTTTPTEQHSGGGKEGGGDEEKKTETIILSECAVIKSGKYVGTLDDEELNGYKWLTGTMASKIITADNVILESDNNKKNTLGISLFSGNTTLKPYFEDGKFILRISIGVKAQIISIENELSTNLSEYRLQKRYEEYKRIIRENIEAEIQDAWDKMKEIECDFGNIEDLFYSRFGKEWENNREDGIIDMLESINMEFDIDVNVISGNTNKRFDV